MLKKRQKYHLIFNSSNNCTLCVSLSPTHFLPSYFCVISIYAHTCVRTHALCSHMKTLVSVSPFFYFFYFFLMDQQVLFVWPASHSPTHSIFSLYFSLSHSLTLVTLILTCHWKWVTGHMKKTQKENGPHFSVSLFASC